MKEYELTHTKTINPASLIIATLYTVKEDKGYISKKDINRIIGSNQDSLDSDIFEKSQDIIIHSISPIRNYINLISVKEFLTGVNFNSVIIPPSLNPYQKVGARVNKRELDSFVYIPYYDNPNNKFLKTYMEKHQDIEAYKKELEELKEHARFMHYIKKETEIDDLFYIK